MRKVKVLALLLAALMVVAVFAGCADTDAIVSDVEDLDQRVEVLEGLLNDNKEAINDVKDQLTSALEEILKQNQEANAATQEQIKDLADKVTKVEEDNKTSDETADEDAALVKAVKEYTAKLQELKITCELSKDGYVPADYEAVVKALSDGIVAVADAKTADEATAAFEAAKAVYDAKATVYSKLLSYYGQVVNNISADSKDLVTEIKAFIKDANGVKCPVTVVYGDTPATNDKLLYNTGVKDVNGKDIYVNLYAELNKAVLAYEYVTGSAFKALVTDAVNKIARIEKVLLSDASNVNAANTAYNAVLVAVKGTASATGEYAAYLADSNMDLVTNVADLTAAQARLNNLILAQAMYKTIGSVAGTTVATPFAKYIALGTKTDYESKPVYDAINAVINAWAAQYALVEDADNLAYIINNAYGEFDYATYLANNTKVELYAKAYADFAAIANRITTLNKVTVLDTAAFDEYAKITKAIEDWKVVRADDKTTKTVNEEIRMDAYNFVKVLQAYGLVLSDEAKRVDENDKRIVLTVASDFNAAKVTKETNYYGLYQFVEPVAQTFFATTFVAADAAAEKINDKIEALAKTKASLQSIKDIVKLEGAYLPVSGATGVYAEAKVTYANNAFAYAHAKDSTKTVVADNYEDGTLTVAQFTAMYKTEAYDLTVLLDLADLAALKKEVSDKIAGFKTSAKDVVALIDAVEDVVVVVGAEGYEAVTATTPATATLKSLVTLADTDAVKAAQAKYDAWVAAGANSAMKEFVAYEVEDANGEMKVVDGEFVFDTIIDTDAIARQRSMDNQINELNKIVTAITNSYSLIKKVNDSKLNSVSIAGLMANDGFGYTALTYSNSSTNQYTGVKTEEYKGLVKNTVTVNGVQYNTLKETSTQSNKNGLIGLTEMLTVAFDLYDVLMAENAEYYYNDKGALKVKPETVASVETLKSDNAGLELIYVKAAVSVKLNAKIKAITESTEEMANKAEILNYLNGFVNEVKNAQNYNQIFSIMKEIYTITSVSIENVMVGAEVVIKTVTASDIA